MASFDPQNAVVYGLTAQQLYYIFTNYYVDPGTIAYIQNSYATVYPFTSTNSPAGNAQAIEDLFPSINSGPDSPTFYGFKEVDGTGVFEIYGYFHPFSNTSAVTITPLATTATANLSDSSLISNEAVVADTSLTFTFIPGAVQSQTLTYEEGTTISNSVTNGITNTSTTTTTTTVTTGVQSTGTIPGASAQVSASVAQAWSIQDSQAINYSQTETDTASTNVTESVTADYDTATPNSDGTYSWTNSTGQTFTLVPGNQYISEVVISTSSYSTPVPNQFNLTGPDMSLPMFIAYNDGFYEATKTVYQNVELAISSANAYGYSQYSQVDSSLFSYQTSPIAQATYNGLISSESVTGYDAFVQVIPVATTSDATSTPTASTTETTTLSLLVSPNYEGTTNLDLHAAAVKLRSSYGIYYNNTNTENQITTRNVQISGEDHASVRVGDLDYTLTNFSNSIISTGSGDNRVIFTGTDINNSVNLGSGNSQIDLNGAGNSIRMGDGANWVNVTGGTGRNFVVAGDGPTTLSLNSDSGFTQVSNWNTSEDAILFSPDIARSNIRVVFDSTHWSQDVYVNNVHVANILTTGGLKSADANSTVYSQTYAAPMPYNVQSNESFVSGLYVDAFSRASDSNGISYWAQQLDAGTSRNALIQTFLTSNEYNANHLSNSAFVNGIYQNVLGRQADASGASYWNAQLDAGTSRIAMVGSFLAGSEFNNLVGAN